MKRFWVLSVAAVGLALSASPAWAAFTFDSIFSTGAVTHVPNPVVPGGTVSKAYPADAPFNGAVSLDLDNTFTSGTSKSIGKGGIDHSTSGGPGGVANLSIATGTGVGQTDKGDFGGNTSKVTLDFNLNWDVSDGWGGPVSVYQSLMIALKTSGPSDLASVSGTFTYNLSVNNGSTLNVDFFSKTISYGSTQTGLSGIVTTSKFLYTSGLLTPSAVPAATGGATNTLQLIGSIVFSAKDPDGDTGTETFDDPTEYFNQLNPLLTFPGGTPPGVIAQHFQTLGGGAGDFQAQQFAQPLDIQISQEVAIPEPATLCLLVLGVAAAGVRFHRMEKA